MAPGGRPVLADVDLQVRDGELAALIGPSGAGKTTLLRAIAGLTPITGGAVAVDGRSLHGVPPHRRGVGLVFQEPRLFPHLSAADNVAFALRLRGVAKRPRRHHARELLDEVGLGALAARDAATLSGGEQQRVALARALAAEPDLLLLDEPFAAVDPNRRDELRRVLLGVQRSRRLTMLLVTHDRAEAAELGDSVAVMIDGRLHQHDTPVAVFERPSTPAVARFVGATTLIRGTVADGLLETPAGRLPVDAGDGPAVFSIRPEHVQIDPDGPLRMRVVEARYTGSHTRLVLAAESFVLEAHVVADVPAVGTIVAVSLPRERLWSFATAAHLDHAAAEVRR